MGDEEEELTHCKRVASKIMADEHDTSENIVEALMRERALASEQGVASVRAKFEVVGAVNQKLMAKLAAIEELCSEAETDSGSHPWEDSNGDCWIRCKDVRKILGGEL